MTDDAKDPGSIPDGCLPLHLIPDGEKPRTAAETAGPAPAPSNEQRRFAGRMTQSSWMLHFAVSVVFGMAFLIGVFLLCGAYITLLL